MYDHLPVRSKCIFSKNEQGVFVLGHVVYVLVEVKLNGASLLMLAVLMSMFVYYECSS